MYRFWARVLRFNTAILLFNCILIGLAFGGQSSSQNRVDNLQETLVKYLFYPLAERVGKVWALTIVIAIGGIIIFLAKNAIFRFIDFVLSSISNLVGRFYGQDLDAYLESVINECKEVRAGFKIFGMDFFRDYVSLFIQTGKMAQDLELKEITEILGQNQRLVIRGRSGAGKSVLLKNLAIRYASRRMKTLHGKHLFPLFVTLKNTSNSPDLFSHLVQICRPYFEQTEEFLRPKLMVGDCIVFLDGLDEVPADRRERTLGRIEDFASEFDQSHIIVTLRREGYEDVEFSPLFTETEIGALTFPQIKKLALSVLRANRGSASDQQLNEKCAKLLAQIKGNDRLRLLAENPMFLSIAALVYNDEGNLPDNRLALYEQFVHLILEVRKFEEGGVSHRLKYGAGQKDEALRKIALFFVEEGMSQFKGEELRKKIADIADVVKLPVEECKAFIDELCKIGILHRVPSLTDTYDFVHHTFLEYFAAREICENRQEKEALIFDFAGDPNWREVILMFVALSGGSKKIVTDVMDRGYTTLAGECFLNIPIPDESICRELIGTLLSGVDIENINMDRARQVLMDLVSLQSGGLVDQQKLQVFLEGRLTDPLVRPDAKAAIYKEKLCLRPDLAEEFATRFGLIYIPEGKSVIGVDSPRTMDSIKGKRFGGGGKRAQAEKPGLELPRQEIDLSAFFIDKFPVTNEKFAQFVNAGGYRDSKYWTDKGWELIEDEHIKEPRYWQDRPWNKAERPVVGVSWYEAKAYAKWAGKQLPTEQMWEKAARGTDERSYPWGNREPDDTKANFGEHIGETTAVRKFLLAKSPFGVCDMSGNVWEWCEDWWDENQDKKVVRGGSWIDDAKSLRVFVRSGTDPWYWYNTVGFRCVRF